jgi:bacterioferritin
MEPTILKLVSKPNPPLNDIETMRKRERQYMEDSVVTSGYAADRETVIKLLNEALATEVACLLRYKHHYFKAATARAARVNQVRGDPISPIELAARSHAEYVEDVSRRAMNQLRAMIKEDLIAERLRIESYRETFSYHVE